MPKSYLRDRTKLHTTVRHELCALLSAMLLLCCAVPALAVENSQSFLLRLDSGGAADAELKTGDTITVTAILERTDSNEDWTMYAYQTELVFDNRFFALVDGGTEALNGALCSVWETGSMTKIYLIDYALTASGERYPAFCEIGRFTLRVLAGSGSGTVENTNYLISTAGGQDTYHVSAEDFTVRLSAGSQPGLGNDPETERKDDSAAPPAERPPVPVQPPKREFTDVAADVWYFDAVGEAVASGAFIGTSETTFSPLEPITRGLFVAALYRLEGEPEGHIGFGFADVRSGAYYADAVNWAAGLQIVSGYGDGRFDPDTPITREQLVLILKHYLEYKGADTNGAADLSTYVDAGSVSGWAEAALRWAVSAGIVQGNGEAMLSPQGIATRAQAAAMLMRAYNNSEY